VNPFEIDFGVLYSAPRVARFSLVAFSGFSDCLAPKSSAFLFRLSSQQQNVIDAGYRSTSHDTSVCVWSRGGLWAADVCASLWLESQLLLQISAADGRADGNPDDDDMAVSEKNCA
jgi:hypothetical protein